MRGGVGRRLELGGILLGREDDGVYIRVIYEQTWDKPTVIGEMGRVLAAPGSHGEEKRSMSSNTQWHTGEVRDAAGRCACRGRRFTPFTLSCRK
jgi:hypothetical protein